jgi:hypothetical protein
MQRILAKKKRKEKGGGYPCSYDTRWQYSLSKAQARGSNAQYYTKKKKPS